ncbi:response regulator [Tritonibacter horizontis]|uniref:Response regulator receiver domain protein n=1 Tax=Tritonibacter horizontis TaxID=1768241 RepID=A0A132BU67_9RHOB|nr:response regulator [Tritonibacter horizontis]KUP91746.1 response regulator receiver domain protein [Tritonibacter horizontis]
MTKPFKILLVDDCDADRYFFKRSLRKVDAGAELVEFCYAEDALGYLTQQGRSQLDCVFVDINMPRLSGFEFADAYQKLYPDLSNPTRLFICSSSMAQVDAERAYRHPVVTDFCEKPVPSEFLRSLM